MCKVFYHKRVSCSLIDFYFFHRNIQESSHQYNCQMGRRISNRNAKTCPRNVQVTSLTAAMFFSEVFLKQIIIKALIFHYRFGTKRDPPNVDVSLWLIITFWKYQSIMAYPHLLCYLTLTAFFLRESEHPFDLFAKTNLWQFFNEMRFETGKKLNKTEKRTE